MRNDFPDPPAAGAVPEHKRRLLLRDVFRFQVKLWLEALRDVVLSPVALAAAALDFVLARQQPPRYFNAMMALGRRSEDWIDLWSQVDAGAKPANVDALLAQIEKVVSDPRAGQRKARVLMRWTEMNLARQKRKGFATLTDSQPPPPPAPE